MSKQITDFQKKEEKPIVIPAALTHAPPPPQIPTQPIPTKPAQPKPETKKPEAKPIPKETQIILKCLQHTEAIIADLQSVLFATRQEILQQYTTVDYNHISYAFPENLAARLDFTEKEGVWIIKPKAFLGSELFGDVVEIIKGLGGEYVSAGKDSHFRVKRN